MRFFSPIFLRQCEFHPIKLALYKNKSPVTIPVAFHGAVTFVPVRAQNVLVRSFDADFLGNPYELAEREAVRDCHFPYVFAEDGSYDKKFTEGQMVGYTTQIDSYIVGGIRVPNFLKNGDIMLCSRRYKFSTRFQ